MFKRRSPPQMTPSDRVRKLWVEFETWHKEQTFLIEQQVTAALHELDAKWRQTPSKKRSPKADHEKRKKTKREEIEKTFNGNMVREEWQKRLDKEGLQSDDWTDLTDAEQKRVEEILGADLDLEEMELPIVQVTPQTSGSLFAPPMTSDSRLGSVSDTYTVVKPGAFKTVTEEPWMQVIQKSRSDDELSFDASTTSSWGLSTNDGAAYRSWSSEASRSSTQTSHASSPEHQTQYLSAEVKQQSLLSAAARRLSEATQRPSRNDNKPATSQSLIPLSRTESLDSTSDDPMSFIGEPPKTTRAASKSRATYIGPHLAESITDVNEEAEFHKFKMDIRIQKIREFHDEAAQADIKLTVEIDDARRLMQSNKDYEAKLLEEHEQKMLQLRKSKEEERKSIVEAERLRRRSTMRVRGQPPPPQQQREPAVDTSDCEIPPSVAAQFLKGLREMEGSTDPGGLSDTSTIRQQQRPSRKPSLFTDWMHGGGDTPTPTARVSAWTAHSSQLSQTPLAESSDMFADAPLSKRGVPDTHSRSRGVPDATPTKASEVSPWSTKNVTSSIPGAWDSEPVASHTVDNTPTQPEKVEKVDPAKATTAVMGKGKKKKGKAVTVAQATTEIESSSNPKNKAGTAVPSTTVSPGPPSSSTKSTKENSTAKSQNEGGLFSPEIDRAATPSAKSTPVWNILPKSKVPPSSAISPSNSSSSTWSSWTSSSSTSQSTTDDQQFWVPGSASKPTTDPRTMNPSPAGKWPSTGSQASDSSTPPPPPSKSTAKSPVTSKSAGKKPEVPQASAGTSSILKKSGSSKTKVAKGSKKKKVTIEEVSDDEGEDPAPDGVERLPSDSRYIMQPAEEDLDPDEDSISAPAPALGSRRGVEPDSSMSGQQQPQQQQPDSYSLWNQVTSSSSQDSTRRVPPSQGQGQQGQAQGPERWIPTPQGRRESGEFWLPGGFNQPAEATSNTWSSRPTFDWNTQGQSGSGSGGGMNSTTNGYTTWTPSARSTGGGHGSYGRRNFEGDPEQDLFLSALDSLENIVRGNDHSHSRNGGYGGGEADNLGRLLSGVGRGQRNGDGDDALWQAIQQYGQRGTGVGATASAW